MQSFPENIKGGGVMIRSSLMESIMTLVL